MRVKSVFSAMRDMTGRERRAPSQESPPPTPSTLEAAAVWSSSPSLAPLPSLPPPPPAPPQGGGRGLIQQPLVGLFVRRQQHGEVVGVVVEGAAVADREVNNARAVARQLQQKGGEEGERKGFNVRKLGLEGKG